MVEAEELCDRVAIINARAGARVRHAGGAEAPPAARRDLPSGSRAAGRWRTWPRFAALGRRWSAAVHRATGRRDQRWRLMAARGACAGRVHRADGSARIGLMNLTKREPTLEDVFVELVGRSMEEVEHGHDVGWRVRAHGRVARAYPRHRSSSAREVVDRSSTSFLPLVGVSAYVFVYRAIHAPEELVGFVILGGAMSAYWMNVLWAMGEPALLGERDRQPRRCTSWRRTR